MKRSIMLMAFGIMLCCICIIQLIYIEEKPFSLAKRDFKSETIHSDDGRETITFILGEDKDKGNPYYGEATLYYSMNPAGVTDYLVTSCRSLLEVKEYLEEHRPCNKQPWGLVNLVSHGNQWVGLSVRVTPHSKRTTTERLHEHIKNGVFRPVRDEVIDEKTEIFVHGCGLGNNQELLQAISIAFGGENVAPVVRAARFFEYYSTQLFNKKEKTERYLAKSWFVNFKMGEKPSRNIIAEKLRDKYPGESIDWFDALSRQKPRFTGDHYYYTFEVPVRFIIAGDQKSAELNSTPNQLAFINGRQEITDQLASLGIPSSAFQWSFTDVFIDNSDGTRSPAILVKGYCTMITILRALTLEGNGMNARPLSPDLNDVDYYYATCNNI